MDIKVNGNLNMQIQNEYLQRATENLSSDKGAGRTEKNGRRAVLERSASAFERAANICYDKRWTS